MTNKIHNKGFLIFLIIAVCFSIGYPIIKRVYLKPKRWKDQLTQRIIEEGKSKASKDQIMRFSECVFNKLQTKYDNVDNFPAKSKYSQQDKIDIILCTAEYLIVDSIQRKEILERLDTIK